MTRILFLTTIALLLFCCRHSDHPLNKFSDPVRLKIADLKDRRLGDSLYPYFSDKNEIYRADAAEAFGSLQDSSAVDRIGKLLLMDGSRSVRKAAAFALGQLRQPACERILLGAVVKEKDPDVTFEILKAYGKTTARWQLDPSVFLNDSIKSAGLAWSVYGAGLRGKADSISNGVARRLLAKTFSQDTRLGAAHFFARGAKAFGNAGKDLIQTSLSDPSAEVRMAAALSLGKIPSDSSLATLKNIIKNDDDGRVVVNAIRALASFPYARIKNYLYEALGRKDVNVGIAASETILAKVEPEDWIEVSSLTTQIKEWRMLANLYEAALKAGKNKDVEKEIEARCIGASDPFHKAAFLSSLKHYPQAFAFVKAQLEQTDTAIVRSAAASTLAAMSDSEDFNSSLRPEFARIFQQLMKSEDPAVLGIIATALANTDSGYKDLIRDPEFLYGARRRLRLPEDNEALQGIERAIAYFEGRKEPARVINNFNHPVNWELVKSVPSDRRAIIKTSRGSIIIRLLVNESPGSVANFIDLAEKNYFDNKFFHRVVPNFVVQAGCPRGDGWGGEDYSIRSEFSARPFRAGMVGMASAGKDTEGTQWFITYSPAPHLDGRYTIFAEVVGGMSVMNYLQVGDKILDVVIERSPAQ